MCGRLVALLRSSRGQCRVGRGGHTRKRYWNWIAHVASGSCHTLPSPQHAYGWRTQKHVVEAYAACSVPCGVLVFRQLAGVLPDLRGMRAEGEPEADQGGR